MKLSILDKAEMMFSVQIVSCEGIRNFADDAARWALLWDPHQSEYTLRCNSHLQGRGFYFLNLSCREE